MFRLDEHWTPLRGGNWGAEEIRVIGEYRNRIDAERIKQERLAAPLWGPPGATFYRIVEFKRERRQRAG